MMSERWTNWGPYKRDFCRQVVGAAEITNTSGAHRPEATAVAMLAVQA